jgi:hypothetical protein
MGIKKIIISLISLTLAYGYPCLAQEEDIPAEDTEIVEVLDILDNLEVLEADIDLMEFLTEVGDDYED